MDVKELEHELGDLKANVDQQRQIVTILLNGGTVLNKRMDMLEALAQALGAIVKMTHDQLDRHLDLFREAGAPPEPKPSKDSQLGIEVA